MISFFIRMWHKWQEINATTNEVYLSRPWLRDISYERTDRSIVRRDR